jgi:hypothetical protein
MVGRFASPREGVEILVRDMTNDYLMDTYKPI